MTAEMDTSNLEEAMAEDRKYKCIKCGLIITLSGSSTAQPDKKQGGPCPKGSSGDHSWTNHR
jgi:DNA-directed RNA polymerase subunit RPC12/RpoP